MLLPAALAIAALAAWLSLPRSAASGGKVLFVGLDGADWQLLDRYVAEGRMPNLAALIREGRPGVLTTQHPPLSPLVWTTMMTGVGPLRHGILDFTRFHPQTGRREPIPGTERRVPAIWNMASAHGRSVAVFGLWATWPAEPVHGLMVSDRLYSFQTDQRQAPAGVVWPPEREAWARDALQRAEREVDCAELRRWLPWLDAAQCGRILAQPDPWAHPVSALRRVLIETRVYDGLATEWLQREQPDLGIVYLQGTDAIGHVYAPYAPPRQPAIPEQEFDRYSEVPARYYAHVDGLLGRYRELAAASGATLLLASDHGFLWGEGRPAQFATFTAATAGRWHRDEGVSVLWGPGVQPAAAGVRDRGSVLQVCATLLALLGLPPGRGLEGPPLAGVAAAEVEPTDYAAAWQRGDAATAPDAGAATDAEALAELEALGYVGAGEAATAPQQQRASGSTRTAGSYNNEGLIRREAGDAAGAAAAFEQALAVEPQHASALWNLSDLLHAQGQADRSDPMLIRALASGLPDGVERAVGRAIGYQRGGQLPRSVALLEAAVAAQPDRAELWLFRGRYRLEQGACAEALADFRQAAQLQPDHPLAHSSAGLASLCLGDEEAARRSFRRSLELDPEQPELRKALEP
jgi:tetratricopeptide (TPR) repeat protein